MMQQSYTIHRLCEAYVPGVAVLEQLCFPHEPWSAQSLCALCQDNAVGFVAVEQDGTVSAYVGMQYAAGEGSITNVATHPEYRRGGRAAALLAALTAFARESGVDSIFLEVRPSNEPAIALYERFGFETVGIRRRFYRAPVEDAKIMRLAVDAAAL